MENFSKKITWFMPRPPRKFLKRGAGLPKGREFFACGRDALRRALKLEKFCRPRRLWIPEFFCPSVARTLRADFDVRFFCDLPSEPAPRFGTIGAMDGDAVLIVNFFGLRDAETWREWLSEHGGVVPIFDHSHAPFSSWAESETRGYSFASLRKTLPLPDGGFLKSASPAKMFLSGGSPADFAADAAAGELLDSFAGYDAAEAFYYSGENKLEGRRGISRISKYSLAVLENFDAEKAARATFRNLEIFCENLKESKNYTELNAAFGNLSDPFRAFSPALKFSDMRARDRYHNALYAAGAKPSIYWGGLGSAVSPRAREESGTTFIIPLDFRHSEDDAFRLAEFVSNL